MEVPFIVLASLTALLLSPGGAAQAAGQAPGFSTSGAPGAAQAPASGPGPGTLAEALASRTDLGTFRSLLSKANLTSLLADPAAPFTLFAPTDNAFLTSLARGNVTCMVAKTVAIPCSSTQDLLASTSLEKLLLNHVVANAFPAEALINGTTLQFLGGSMQMVNVTRGNRTYIGNAPITRLGAATSVNGVLHILDEVIFTDAGLNASSLLVVEKAGDCGPFNSSQRQELANQVPTLVASYRRIRQITAFPEGGCFATQSPLVFDPTLGADPPLEPPLRENFSYSIPAGIARPADNESLAFMTVLELASLLRSGQTTSMELTRFFLDRMKRYEYVLEAVVTYTEELALQQAAAADALLAAGRDLGPLHGIPYGLKDTISVAGYPTTWGAAAYKDQVIDQSAYVYDRLRAAGAVLLAKLASGEMAYSDVWWGGWTKNPWNIAEGSSGSSAGTSASVTAGTLPFAIGSETGGSIMGPAERQGVSALRPSFGAIGRTGTMSLCPSIDKLGPFCRSASDCAVVLDVLRGRDPADLSSRDLELEDPFTAKVKGLRVGFMQGTSGEVLRLLQARGVALQPFSFNYTAPAQDMFDIVLVTEAAAHFEHWQRSGADDLNRRQDLWPSLLRKARLIPAVEYVQANRARQVLCQQVADVFSRVDAVLLPPLAEVPMGNLCGLPVAVVATGFSEVAVGSSRKDPQTVAIMGPVYGDGTVLALAMAWQSATTYHLQRPPVDRVEASVLANCSSYSRCLLPPSVVVPIDSGARPDASSVRG